MPSSAPYLILLQVIFVLSWSSGFIGARLGTEEAGAINLLFWRFLLVSICLLPFVVLAGLLGAAVLLWPLLALADGRPFAELWQAARIDQQLWPAAFQWRGVELTPAELMQANPAL